MKEEHVQLDDVAVASPVRPLTSVCPWSAVVALILSLINALALAICIPAGGLGPRLKIIDPHELWHAKYAVFLLCPAVVTEMSFLCSSYSNIELVGWSQKGVLQLNGIGDSLLTVAEYLLKLLCGLVLWSTGGGVVHSDQLAWGGGRPVYFVRFLQWAIAVPILVLITNRAFLAEVGDVVCFLRSAPGLLLTALSVWAAWLMEVTPSPAVRWLMWTLSWMSLIWVMIDQCLIAAERKGCQLHGLKVAFLSYQTVTFALYAVVFMFGRLGVVTSLHEQMFYAYGDVTIKVIGGSILAMIRNREDLMTVRHWWLTAIAKSQDLERIMRQANVPVIAANTEGLITAWNESVASLSGFPAETVLGKKLSEMILPSCLEVLQEAMDRVIKDGASASGIVELSLKREPGKAKERQGHMSAELPVIMNILPQTSNSLEVDGIVAIGQDLTELSTMKAVEEKKSRLMAMVSHELRSPLHGMIGLTNMMIDSEAGKSLHRQLSMVRNCSARLLDLVTNVMDMAESEKRKTSGAAVPRPSSPINFATIADEVIVMTRLAVDKANKPLVQPEVQLNNSLSEMDMPVVLGDPYKCTQLLYNLLTNACKFTKSGSVTIAARHIKEAKMLEIDVIDTGRGISEEAQDRIFKPFEQEHSGDARNFQGMGLGLAVCTEIVKLHNGTIRVKSATGRGSTFTVSVPCTEQLFKREPQAEKALSTTLDPRQTGSSRPPPPPSGGPLGKGSGKGASLPSSKAGSNSRPMVLSVDDDEVNQEVIRKALSSEYEVERAMDGQEALDFLKQRKQKGQPLPDIILLDIQMPGLSGYEVCTEIRASFEKALGKLPIIMLSAKAPVDGASLDAFDHGSTDYLPKPFSVEVLKRRIRVALEIKSQIPDGDMGFEGSAHLIKTLDKLKAKLAETQKEVQDQKRECDDLKKRLQEANEAKESPKESNARRVPEPSALRDLRALEAEDGPLGLESQLLVLEAEHRRQMIQVHKELQEREDAIVRLGRELAGHRAARQMINAQLEWLVRTAETSKMLLAKVGTVEQDLQAMEQLARGR